ncbi:MAG: putative zinc-binding protein [Candidatus Altiarchaeia archaeon]
MDNEHKTTLLYACNGVSAYGQLTNEASHELEDRDVGHVACLAGVGAGIPSKIKAANEADRRIALDGCKLCCAKKILEKAGIKDIISIVAIESGTRFSSERPTADETKQFSDYVVKRLQEEK